MTSLRTMWGLDTARLERIAAGSAAVLLKQAASFFEKGWLVRDQDKLLLTRSGKLYADHIAAELFF